MKNGDLVTFKKGLYADEENVVYMVIEMNEDRCFIQFFGAIENGELVVSKLTYNPQSVARTAELEPYNG